MLYPVMNQYRTIVSLNGMWDFDFVSNDYLPTKPLVSSRLMSVPSSYNDIGVTSEFRDYVGIVAYEKSISIPNVLLNENIHLRIGSASHQTRVYIDGKLLGEHIGGFLPMDFSLSENNFKSSEIRITILVDNRLDFQSFPMGEIIQKDGVEKQIINYDFFNYSGIHRDVLLYTTPKKAIKNIELDYSLTKGKAVIFFSVDTDSNLKTIQAYDPFGKLVCTSNVNKGILTIENPILWGIGKGNLYKIKVSTTEDEYTLRIGLREIVVEKDKILLNGEKIYLKGFGKHEDFFLSGKGNNSSVNLRDFELMKWIHANSFRTSHYPYAEEIYDLADEYGVLVIDEVPAVGFNFWNQRKVYTPEVANSATLEEHKLEVKALIDRDRFHPSVIMISLANEANTHEANAFPYYKSLVEYTRTLTKLPLTIVEWVGPYENKVASLIDVIGVNRYIGWYTDFADLNIVEDQLEKVLTDYHRLFDKPILLSEFGADAESGFHSLPSLAFTEEFQVDFIEKYTKVASKLNFIIGEHVWNFADFMTKQGLTRFIGNKKGIFTRDRQPKMVAHYLRKHWKE